MVVWTSSNLLYGNLSAQEGPVCLTLLVWLPVSPRRTNMPHTTCVVACRPNEDQYALHYLCGCLLAQEGSVCLTLLLWLLVGLRRTSIPHTIGMAACRLNTISVLASMPHTPVFKTLISTMHTTVKCNGCVYAMDTLSINTLSHLLSDRCDHFVLVPSVK